MEPAALKTLRAQHLLAAIRAPSADAALSAAQAVAKGGISLLEITFTVPDAPRVMAALASAEGVVVGAGTVLTSDQCRAALDAGARFILSPVFSPDVARVALAGNAMYVPGAYTPAEIVAARHAGAHVVKVYPVGVAGGPKYIQVIREPLPDIPLLASGGTTLENLAPFLHAGCVAVGLGGALADAKLVETGQLDEITRRARAFVHRVTEARATGLVPKEVA